MARRNVMQHGTPQGYKKHLDKDSDWSSEPCDECRAAHNREVAEYRERSARNRAADIKRAAARRRALSRLVQEYPENVGRYEKLLKEEMETSR